MIRDVLRCLLEFAVVAATVAAITLYAIAAAPVALPV
jgi:hypothetical protein